MRIAAEDYDDLKAFFGWMSGHWYERVLDMPPDLCPMAQLEQTEARSRSQARTGLAMAIGDIIEMTENLAPDQVARIDTLLDERGILTLTNVRARFWSRIRRLLERGAIKSERDYYAVRNIVDALPEEEQGRAWQMLGSFEQRGVSKAR